MKYIAHRGLSSQAPENTIASFSLAAKNQHFYGIECDVYSTKDGEFVVFHDDNLKRMAKATRNIMDLTYPELSEYSIKTGSKIRTYRNEKIPLLTAFLDICLDNNKAAVIEIKKVHDITQLTNLVAILDNYPSLTVILISFNLNYLKYLRAITNIDLQYLTQSISTEIMYDCRANHIDMSVDKDKLTPAIVKKLKKEGFKIAVYTVDSISQALQYEKMGIDFLTTNSLWKRG
jgi:glycerophosphoryl diester phosphodiesterase